MAIALGGTTINKAYLGATEIQKMYLGSQLVFDNTVSDLMPIMTNFRTDDTNKDRIYFDTPLGSVDGIDSDDFIITGKTITAVDTTDNYFTLSADLDFYDNILIRKEGGDNTVVYDFTLQNISNNINEPSADTIRYAAPTTQGSGNGLDEANAWSYATAGTSATSGMTVMMLAGSTSTAMNISNSGTLADPIKFVGYNNAAKDVNRTRSLGMAMDATVMPLFTGVGSSYSITNGQDHTILRNIQIFNPSLGGINMDGAVKQIFDNLYIDNDASADHCIWSNLEDTRGNKRILNSYLANANHHGVKWGGVSNSIRNTWSISSKSSGMDYYFLFDGGEPGFGHSNSVIGCYINRFVGDSHSGHGVSFKADQNLTGWVLEHSLIEDCDIINTKVEFRHRPCRYNVARNVRNDLGIACMLHDGPSYNIFEDCIFKNNSESIKFYESVEDGDVQPNAHNMKWINCIFDGATTICGDGELAPVSMLPDIDDNQWINCTFKNVTNFVDFTKGAVLNNTNKVTNCILDTVANLGSNANNLWEHSDFYNGFAQQSGTGNFSIDPQLNASYQPQADFSTIDVPRIDGVFYGYNGIERQNPTTVGSVLSASEVPADIPFAITLVEISAETATTAFVRATMTEQCSINYYVDGVLNAASSGTFDAFEAGPNEWRHGRTLTGLTPGTTANLVISVTAQDDGEVVQSGNISITTLAPTYTVSNTDGAADYTTVTALLANETLVAGDVVGLKGGDEFYESVSINASGAVDNPITFTSYGSGKAVIKGSEAITGWTNTSGNIWEADVTGKTIYQVFNNDAVVTLARIPTLINDLAFEANYYNITTEVGNLKTQFISTDLAGRTSADLVGTTCRVMSSDWWMDTKTVTAFNEVTYQVTLDSDVSYNLNATDEFFLCRGYSYLDSSNEWFYDSSADKLFVYSVGTPTNITANTLDDTAIVLTDSDYITFDNLHIKDFYEDGIRGFNCDNLTITNNKLSYCYNRTIEANESDNVIINDNEVHGGVNIGMYVWLGLNAEVQRNYIHDIMMLSAMTEKSAIGWGIMNNTQGSLVKNNHVERIGYNGIGFGTNSVNEQNLIKDYCLTMHDGGGFYPSMGSQPHAPGGNISDNILVCQEFNNNWLAEGIYFDGYGINNILVENNTIINSHAALFYQATYEVTMQNNTIYKPNTYGALFTHLNNVDENAVYGNVLNGNQIFMKGANATAVRINSSWAGYDVGTFDLNNYYTVYNETPNWITNSVGLNEKMRLEEWQTNYLMQDLNSIQNQILWADYTVDSINSNLVTSDFSVDNDGFSANDGVLTRIDNGGEWGLQIDPTAVSVNSRINSPFLNLVDGNTYTLEFDAKGDGVGDFKLEVVSGSTLLISRSIYPQSEWTSYKIQFTAIEDNASGRGRWYSTDDKLLEIMNVVINDVELGTLPVQDICPYNETTVAKDIALPSGTWTELDDVTTHTGTITLQPYTSKILTQI